MCNEWDKYIANAAGNRAPHNVLCGECTEYFWEVHPVSQEQSEFSDPVQAAMAREGLAVKSGEKVRGFHASGVDIATRSGERISRRFTVLIREELKSELDKEPTPSNSNKLATRTVPTRDGLSDETMWLFTYDHHQPLSLYEIVV